MLPSGSYLYHSVISIWNVLKFTQINLITNNDYYVIVKTGQADSSGSFSNHHEIKQCCHFLVNRWKIFKLLIKPLFLRLFQPDQSEIKEIFQEIVNIHNGGNFQERNTYFLKLRNLSSSDFIP